MGATPLGLANATPPEPSSGIALTGVFDESSGELKLGRDGLMETKYRPVLGMRVSDLAAAGITAAQGDQVEIAGTVYNVADVEPDSHGHVLLRLSLA